MRIVDLTVTIGPDTLSPPSANKRLTLTSNYRGPGFWRASSVDMVLHTGSHVDFSLHVREGGETAADVVLDRICGEALVLDMTHLGPDMPITVEDVIARANDIRPGDIILVRTDWTEKMWGNFPDYYLHSPYCSPEAVEYLVLERKVKAVGFDCFSEYCARLPNFTSEEFIVHKIILENGAILMQQMTNLSKLPVNRHFQFFAPCIKMVGAEGSPARFFALLDE
ncbi:MAG: cyclase [Chloroflexota bacterium]|nr:cyclase family protein [Chloroflexota bacterium]NOG63274.1 cyclase family protein [Chloroflexota bacterium]GIK64533.1 MAG: cyclase [Chloroflexota bacterium]